MRTTRTPTTYAAVHYCYFSSIHGPIALAVLLSLATVLSGCGHSQESARKELAKLGKDFNTAVFMNCIRDGDKMSVRLFIEAGMDVNKPESSGFTPLMIAAWNGNADAAKLLVDKGADLDAALADGRTALQIANERQHLDVAKMLVARVAKGFTFIGTWVQDGDLADATWEFRSDGTYSSHRHYKTRSGDSETLTGPYKTRQPQGPVSGLIVECSFVEHGEEKKMLLRVVGNRLFELNSDFDETTDNPHAWLNRK